MVQLWDRMNVGNSIHRWEFRKDYKLESYGNHGMYGRMGSFSGLNCSSTDFDNRHAPLLWLVLRVVELVWELLDSSRLNATIRARDYGISHR